MNMKKDKEEKGLDEQTMEECKILYCSKNLPMTETCMCWGWETGPGFFENIKDMSCQLEALNILYYPKWKVRIQMDQVKSKFGTLRGYFSVVCDNYNLIGKLGVHLRSLCRKIDRKVSFKMKSVVDQEEYVTDETQELTKEEYDHWKKNNYVEQTLREEDGKYYRDYKLHHCAKMHYEPTKHKIIWKTLKALGKLAFKMQYKFGQKKSTDEQKVIITAMHEQAEKIVREAEEKCYSTCEECGWQIGTNWSPRCQTTGWISYICEKCAKKSSYQYIKNGELWQGEERIKTKEELDADRNKCIYD